MIFNFFEVFKIIVRYEIRFLFKKNLLCGVGDEENLFEFGIRVCGVRKGFRRF